LVSTQEHWQSIFHFCSMAYDRLLRSVRSRPNIPGIQQKSDPPENSFPTTKKYKAVDHYK
jgi:hypothetical protein